MPSHYFLPLFIGQLELHKEIVSPGQFVKDSVAMFNVQARDCGVILKVTLYPKSFIHYKIKKYPYS